jgi:hypothetical protein
MRVSAESAALDDRCGRKGRLMRVDSALWAVAAIAMLGVIARPWNSGGGWCRDAVLFGLLSGVSRRRESGGDAPNSDSIRKSNIGNDLDAALCGIKMVGSPFRDASLASSESNPCSESRVSATFESAHCSVVAGVRPRIRRVIWATKAVAVKAAASEMTSSMAKVASAHARHVTSAKATHVTSAEAAHVASTKAAHMASATTSVSSATSMSTSTAAARLCIGGKKAAGKHRTRQNHHHSSSHDILLWMSGTFRYRASSDAGVFEEDKCRVVMDWR